MATDDHAGTNTSRHQRPDEDHDSDLNFVGREALHAAIKILREVDLFSDKGVHFVSRCVLKAFLEVERMATAEGKYLDPPHIIATALWFQMTLAEPWELPNISPWAIGATPLLAFARVMMLADAADRLSTVQSLDDGELIMGDHVAEYSEAVSKGLEDK